MADVVAREARAGAGPASEEEVLEVRRWQLRQTDTNRLELLVVPSPAWRPEAAREIATQLGEKFGRGLQFEVIPVDDIPLAPSGKLQTIVPLPQDAETATS